FREDLFFRLAVIRLTVPPLRQRLEDIAELAGSFATELGSALPDATVAWLSAQPWPGNVRELRNAVQSFAVLGTLPDRGRSADLTAGSLAPGTVVRGKYRVVRELGQGGMGVVLEAVHVELGRAVALKLMLPDAARTRGTAERFLREARIVANLESPHIARVID